MSLRDEIIEAIDKHLGPGPHPDGSPQSVHSPRVRRLMAIRPQEGWRGALARVQARRKAGVRTAVVNQIIADRDERARILSELGRRGAPYVARRRPAKTSR